MKPITQAIRLGLVGLAMLLAGCSMSGDTAIAERAVPQFHASFDAGQFEAIYAAAAEDLKRQATKDEFIARLESIRRQLGATKSSTQQGWTVNYNGSGTFVTLNYATIYEQGEADEHFAFRVEGDKALLAGYRVDSRASIIDRPSKGGLQVRANETRRRATTRTS